MTDLLCLRCGAPVPITRIGNRGRQAKYCGEYCRRQFAEEARAKRYFEQNPDLLKICASCNREFTSRIKAQRFCSVDCRLNGHRIEGFSKRALTKRTSFEYDCDLCHEPIYRDTPLGGKRRYHAHCSQIAQQARYRKKTVSRRSQTKPSGVYVEQLLERDGFLCYLCKEPIDMAVARTSKRGATVDHVIPLSRGGTDEIDNLRLAHWECNRKKSNKLVEELNA